MSKAENQYSDDPPAWSLCAADAEALDALVGAGFDCSGLDWPVRERAERIAAVLGLIDAGQDRLDPALVDVTLARISRSGGRQGERAGGGPRLPTGGDEAVLSQADASALESWVMNGYRSDRVPASLRERARRHERLARLVTEPGADAAGDDSLIQRTMARVEQAEAAGRERMRFEARREARPGVGVRLSDLASVAAVLLIGVAIVWPLMSMFRAESQRLTCLSNFGAAASAFSLYAGDHRAALPVLNASLNGGTWWNTGKDPQQSNSANLFQLTRAGHAALGDLACPGNPSAPQGALPEGARDWRNLEEVSYSYQIMYGRERPDWRAGQRAVVLADRSPLVVLAVRGQPVTDERMNSLNHGGRGQHVLYNDGSAEWRRSPVLEDGDNIWLPRPLERLIDQYRGRRPPLEGNETPESATDAFVGP